MERFSISEEEYEEFMTLRDQQAGTRHQIAFEIPGEIKQAWLASFLVRLAIACVLLPIVIGFFCQISRALPH